MTMKIERFAYLLISIALIIVFLIVAKDFLVPIILAVVLWYIVNSVDHLVRRIPLVKRIHRMVTLFISFALILGVIFSFGSLIIQNVNSMIENASDYRGNFNLQLQKIATAIGYHQVIDFSTITGFMDLHALAKDLLNGLTDIARKFLLVLLYTLFLLIEQHTFPRKFKYLYKNREKKDKALLAINSINNSVEKYVGVKFLASIATGVLSFIVIHLVGLDYAVFWAFLIFLLNFIPTIGSIVATIFPATIALLQYESLTPFIVILIGVGIIQLIIGGILEPRFYGSTLNISPFVIILSLILWGILWGIVGMLLCVPITVVIIKVLAMFERSRPLAIVLSQTGRIPTNE